MAVQVVLRTNGEKYWEGESSTNQPFLVTSETLSDTTILEQFMTCIDLFTFDIFLEEGKLFERFSLAHMIRHFILCDTTLQELYIILLVSS